VISNIHNILGGYKKKKERKLKLILRERERKLNCHKLSVVIGQITGHDY
jgi:hypothetical protein